MFFKKENTISAFADADRFSEKMVCLKSRTARTLFVLFLLLLFWLPLSKFCFHALLLLFSVELQ
jgi:hypothetical protein